MLHFIYFFNISSEYFKHAAHSPFFSSKCRLFHNATFFGSCIIHILHTGCAKIKNLKFKVCKSVHHRTIQINHQQDATSFQFIILTFVYSSTCFGRFPAHHKEPNDWRRTQHDYHHHTKVKPEAATAVIELLMMGRKTPETCWAVNKGQDNKLKNCCIWLVIYFNCTVMHGLANLKFYI
jgi:hypothetical protein